ncbi:MAG: hypothetical protein ABJF23_25000 [Bryobacteraceae bacterium]
MSKLSRALPVFLFCLTAMQAQVQREGVLLAPDSPELYESFFYLHNDMSNFVEQKTLAEPSALNRLEDGTATVLRVAKADLPSLRAVSRQVIADLKKIDDDRRDHLNKRARIEIGGDPTVLRDFALRRQQIVAAGMDQLSKTLSPASWTGLRSFINDRHRQGIRVLDTGSK